MCLITCHLPCFVRFRVGTLCDALSLRVWFCCVLCAGFFVRVRMDVCGCVVVCLPSGAVSGACVLPAQMEGAPPCQNGQTLWGTSETSVAMWPRGGGAPPVPGGAARLDN